MTFYYVNQNAQENGDHEVHRCGCDWMPAERNRTYVGDFESCEEAILAARKLYPRANGCRHCCQPCHAS